MTESDFRQLALTLRDLCEHTEALSVAALFPGGISVAYSHGMASVLSPDGRVDIPDSDLDDVGLVPAITGDVDELVLAQVGSLGSVTKQP